VWVVVAGKLAAEFLRLISNVAGIQHQWTCSSIPLDEHNASQKKIMQALKYLLYACSDCDGRKERRSKCGVVWKWWGAC
jgi:hypothetical protein